MPKWASPDIAHIPFVYWDMGPIWSYMVTPIRVFSYGPHTPMFAGSPFSMIQEKRHNRRFPPTKARRSSPLFLLFISLTGWMNCREHWLTSYAGHDGLDNKSWNIEPPAQYLFLVQYSMVQSGHECTG